MLTEKNMYKFLKDISKNKDLNIPNYIQYKSLSYEKNEVEIINLTKITPLIKEVINRNFILENSIKIGYVSKKTKDDYFECFGNTLKHFYIPVLYSYPIITVEGNKFMKDYKNQTLKFIPIILDWILRIIGAYAIIKEPTKLIVNFLYSNFFK